MALTNAAKQASHRARRNTELSDLRNASRVLLDSLATAAEASGSHRLTNNLPEGEAAAMLALASRLTGRKIIALRTGYVTGSTPQEATP